MSELITDEIVEVTAQAFYEAEEREVGTLEVHPWDGVIGERREAWKICARAALEAATPLIAGRALREAADGMYEHQHAGCFKTICADCRERNVRTGVRAHLRSRADRIESERSGA